MDISKQVTNDGMGPFMTGAVCSTVAWLSIWPLDVVKSQIQSGHAQLVSRGMLNLLKDSYKSGALYRGLMPGLTRSALANGLSMVVYKRVENMLKDSVEQQTDSSR